MSRFWNAKTTETKPYTPGEQPSAGVKYIKINTNENPYPPSPKVYEAINNSCNEELRLYPNPEGLEARTAFASANNLDVNQVFVGNGSDEVLAMAFMAFYDNLNPIMILDISYSFYPVYCKRLDVAYNTIPVNNDFTINVDRFLEPSGGVVIANPNAPTSIAICLDDIKSILEAHPNNVVIIDEAYIDFGGESAIPLIAEYENLLVVQTLSKSRSLAGMRIGFAAGNPQLIEGLDRVKNSFNSYTIDRLAIVAAKAALEDTEHFTNNVNKIIKTREYVVDELKSLGFGVLDSKANFIFITHSKFVAKDIFMYLKTKGILVRYFDLPRVSDYLRVTIGTDYEMCIFIEKIKKFIEV